MNRAMAWALVASMAGAAPGPAWAYLKVGTTVDGRVVAASWRDQPLRYFVTERDGPGVSSSELHAAAGRAAATWQGVDSATVRVEFQAMTTALPDEADGQSTIGFLDRPELDRVLGATSLMIDDTTGAIVEADIFLNSRFAWSVAPQGEAGRVDVESIVLHELGHALGLSHSALGETERSGASARRVLGSGAVMFPIAMSAGAIAERTLHADDLAGISDIYPAAGELDRTGSITGRVTGAGRGVFGAHVVAFNPETGALVGNFSLDAEGRFVIARLLPGAYILRVEPLDDADTGSFFSVPVDLDFKVTYSQRIVVAPKGGTSADVVIAVLPK